MDPEEILSKVKELDSRQFLDNFKDMYGYNGDEFKNVVAEAVRELQEDAASLLRLGFLHLLLEDYGMALSAYMKYFHLVKSCKDPDYFFGLGLIFLEYNSDQLTTIAFQQVLYLDPSFQLADDIHMRLGYIAMNNRDFEKGLKHFTMVKNDPCLFNYMDIRFYIASLHEDCGKHREAMALYTALLEDRRLSSQLRSDIYCQIGRMHSTVETFGEKVARTEQAIQFLILAARHETNKTGRALRLLGRCFESIGRDDDAFLAYTDSWAINGRNPYLWCSIGNLYFKQKRLENAIIAYHNAVKLNEYQWAAWRNLYVVHTVMAINNPEKTPEAALDALSKADAALAFLVTDIPRTVNMNLSPKQRMEYLEDQMSVSLPVQMMQLTRQRDLHRLRRGSKVLKEQLLLPIKLASEVPPPIPPPGLFSHHLSLRSCTRGTSHGAGM